MALQEKQLGQIRPANTSPASLYSPGTSTTAIIKSITICNNTNQTVLASVFLDDDGSDYTENTALYFEVEIPAKTTVINDSFYAMNNSNGNLGVQSSVANALTFTACGAEVT